jgi:anti-sigma factor (TIGR02949 family)
MDDDIDCTKAMHALYEFLDGELTVERREYIEYHLNGCPQCFSAFDFEAELRIVVRSRLRAEVPSELMERIAMAIEAERGRSTFGGAPTVLGRGTSPLPGEPPRGRPGPLGGNPLV